MADESVLHQESAIFDVKVTPSDLEIEGISHAINKISRARVGYVLIRTHYHLNEMPQAMWDFLNLLMPRRFSTHGFMTWLWEAKALRPTDIYTPQELDRMVAEYNIVRKAKSEHSAAARARRYETTLLAPWAAVCAAHFAYTHKGLDPKPIAITLFGLWLIYSLWMVRNSGPKMIFTALGFVFLGAFSERGGLLSSLTFALLAAFPSTFPEADPQPFIAPQRWALVIDVPSGEKAVLESTDYEALQRVARAVNNAVAERPMVA